MATICCAPRVSLLSVPGSQSPAPLASVHDDLAVLVSILPVVKGC